MVEMEHDDVLKQWAFVKTSSQGVSTAPMPYFAYNRFLELIDTTIIEKHDLQPEITASFAPLNTFSTEEEFEDKVIEPILKR